MVPRIGIKMALYDFVEGCGRESVPCPCCGKPTILYNDSNVSTSNGVVMIESYQTCEECRLLVIVEQYYKPEGYRISLVEELDEGA